MSSVHAAFTRVSREVERCRLTRLGSSIKGMSKPHRYEIEIRGRATERLLRPVVDDFAIEVTDHGTTRLTGEVSDSSHLNGLLAHFTSMHVEVVELRRIDNTEITNQQKEDQP